MTRSVLALALAAGTLGACSKEQAQNDQNVVITDNIPANADVEALPPDESVPSDESIANDQAGNATNDDGNGY